MERENTKIPPETRIEKNLTIFLLTGRPRPDQRRPIDSDMKRKTEPMPNAWAVPLQQSEAFKNNSVRGKPRAYAQFDVSKDNQKYPAHKNEPRPRENIINTPVLKIERNPNKSNNTSNLDDALKTMLRIGAAPENPTTPEAIQNAPNQTMHEMNSTQSIDLKAMFQKPANGVPGFEEFPRIENLPKPPAAWHQKPKEEKQQEDEIPPFQQQPQQTDQPLQPQHPFYMLNQPPMPVCSPNFIPILPFPPLHYAMPPAFYPPGIPPPMPMMPANFNVPTSHQSIRPFAQYPVQTPIAQSAPVPNVYDAKPSAAVMNTFIPLQAARKFAKDKANTKSTELNNKQAQPNKVRERVQ